jgi:hypothetical protein
MEQLAQLGFQNGKIKVVHLTASVSREAGGLFESVRHLAKSTNRTEKLDLRIIGLTDHHTNQDFKEWFPLDVRTHAIRGWKRFGYAPGLYRDLRNSAPDLVHLHGLWKYPSVVVRRWASRSGLSLSGIASRHDGALGASAGPLAERHGELPLSKSLFERGGLHSGHVSNGSRQYPAGWIR